jgi:hypothetical protein
MPHRILRVEMEDERLEPAVAQMRVRIVTEQAGGNLEVRGRLTGPRCLYASTVEVAYPLAIVPDMESADKEITGRFIVPEPSFWEPETPFLYQASIELMHAGSRVDHARLSHGFRTVAWRAGNLRANGRKLVLHGADRQSIDESELSSLRKAGRNCLLVPFAAGETVLTSADRFGFFVLGELSPATDPKALAPWTRHPSLLGWVFDQPSFSQEKLDEWIARLAPASVSQLIVLRVNRVPSPLPRNIIVLCRQDLVAGWLALGAGVIVDRADASEASTETSGVLGWIER